MRGIVGSLNMFLLDYMIVPIWTVFSILGNRRSAYIMLPVTIIFLALNYLNTKNTTRLLLLDMNLSAACLIGIVLNTFLYLKFIYADAQIVTNMVSIIFFYVIFNILACIVCLFIKAMYHRHNLRIISRMAADDSEFDLSGYEDDDEDDEYEDDEEDEYEDEEYDIGERGSFISSIGDFLSRRGNDEEDEEEESDDDEDDEDADDDDGYVKPDGPKFRVVKK